MSTNDSTKIPIPDDLRGILVQIIERLERLEARAYHAQPDLPSMLKQVLDVALEPIHAGIQKLETEVHELKSEVHELKSEVHELKSEVHELKTRVEKLEQRQEHVETELKHVKVELGDMDRSIMRVQGDVVRRLERFDDRIVTFENRQLVSK